MSTQSWSQSTSLLPAGLSQHRDFFYSLNNPTDQDKMASISEHTGNVHFFIFKGSYGLLVYDFHFLCSVLPDIYNEYIVIFS